MLNEKLITSGSYNNFYTEEYAFGEVQSLAEVAGNLQTGIRLATSGLETAEYDTDHFKITSATKNRKSQVLKLMTPSTGTDISGAGATPYLDMADNATETQGTGEEYRLVRLNEDGVLPDEVLDGVSGENLTDLNRNETFTLVASDNARTTASAESATITGTTPTKVKEILLNDVSGTVRIKFYLRMINGAGPAIARVYKNGVAIGAEITENKTSFVEKSTDLGFTSGDLIQVYLYGSTAGTTSSLTGLTLCYDKQPATINNTVNLD